MKLESICPLTTNSSSELFIFKPEQKSSLVKVLGSLWGTEVFKTEEDFWKDCLEITRGSDERNELWATIYKERKYLPTLEQTRSLPYTKLFSKYVKDFGLVSFIWSTLYHPGTTVEDLLRLKVFPENFFPIELGRVWNWDYSENLDEESQKVIAEFTAGTSNDDDDYWEVTEEEVSQFGELSLVPTGFNHPDKKVIEVDKDNFLMVIYYLCAGLNIPMLKRMGFVIPDWHGYPNFCKLLPQDVYYLQNHLGRFITHPSAFYNGIAYEPRTTTDS